MLCRGRPIQDIATRVKDKDLVEAYAQTMAHLEADMDAGQLSLEEEDIIYKRISGAYDAAYERVAIAAAAASAKSKADDYGARFDKAYASLRAGKPAIAGPPYDAAALTAAGAERDKAIQLCKTSDGETLIPNVTVTDNCVVPAHRRFAAAIKLQDFRPVAGFHGQSASAGGRA